MVQNKLEVIVNWFVNTLGIIIGVKPTFIFLIMYTIINNDFHFQGIFI